MNTVHVMSSIIWRNIINGGCHMLYRVSDVKPIVCAMSNIKSVRYQ